MDSGDETSEYGTVRMPVGCRSVRLPTSPDYARNAPIILESVPIMLALCSIFPRPYYAGHYAGIIRPSLVLSVKTLKIDSSSISTYRASVRPIRLQQTFLSTWFKVEGQVVERWERPDIYLRLDPTTDPGRSSQHTGAFAASRGRAEDGCSR